MRLQLAVSFSILALVGTIQAQLIDVDFNTNSAPLSAGGPAIGPTMSGAAVLGTTGDHWNGIDVTGGTGIPLVYANGSNSPVTMTFTSGGGYDANSYGGSTPFASTPLDGLMEDYLYNGGAAQTITLSGLTPNSTYDLVLYNAGDIYAADRITSFTVNSNVQSSTWNGSSNTLIAGVNYVEFSSAKSDHSGKLVITWSGSGTAEGDLDGFQIQPKPGSVAPGLDASFAGSGKTLISFGDGTSAANAVAIQPDGKIVVAGVTSGNHSGLALARLNSDGSPDLSFGVNGKTTTSDMDNATAVAIQTDGKIVAAGGNNEFELARYDTNGLPDTSFGSNGIAKVFLSTGGGSAYATAIQTDGKIVVCGSALQSGVLQFAVIRFNTNGALDTSFGSGGEVFTTIETRGEALDVGIQPDGKIVAGGLALTQDQGGMVTSLDFAAARYKTNGALDLTFGSLGRTTNNVGGGTWDIGYALAIQPDGKILLAGGAGINSVPPDDHGTCLIALARFNTNGVPDTTFGSNGTVVTEVGASSDFIRAVKLQSNGKILVCGSSRNGNYEWFVQRYNSDGSTDSTYGDDSVRFVNFGSGTNEYANALALDSSSRAVVVGDAGGLFGVARLVLDLLPVTLKISLTHTNTVLISWPYPSTGWSLQQNSSLETTNWVTPPGIISNDGTNNFIEVSPASGNLFFRLRQ